MKDKVDINSSSTSYSKWFDDDLIKDSRIEIECPYCQGTGIIDSVDSVGIVCNECMGTGKQVINNNIKILPKKLYKSKNMFGEVYYQDTESLFSDGKTVIYSLPNNFIGYKFIKKNHVDGIKHVSGSPVDIYDLKHLMAYETFYKSEDNAEMNIVNVLDYINFSETMKKLKGSSRVLKQDE